MSALAFSALIWLSPSSLAERAKPPSIKTTQEIFKHLNKQPTVSLAEKLKRFFKKARRRAAVTKEKPPVTPKKTENIRRTAEAEDNRDPAQPRAPQAGGIILEFEQRPNEEEAQIILQYAEDQGLEKTREFFLSKAWVFSWQGEEKLQPLIQAYTVCFNFPKIAALKDCYPNELLEPKDLQVTPAFKSCHIIPSCKAFGVTDCPNGLDGPFWAQARIGADLLREELNKTPAPQHKTYLVSIFDTWLPNDPRFGYVHPDHHFTVKNLVSGTGRQAVLPASGHRAIAFAGSFATDVEDTKQILFEEIQKQCGARLHPGWEDCQKRVLPSYINYSHKIVGSGALMLRDELYHLKEWIKTGSPKNQVEYQRLFPLHSSIYPYKDLHKPETLQDIENRITQYTQSIANSSNRLLNAYRPLSLLSSAGSTVVIASGNTGGFVAEADVKASRYFDAILVGSVDSRGRKSSFSDEHEELVIMAPGENVYSTDPEGSALRNNLGFHTPHGIPPIQQNGTSFAAPLVTGSLAGFEWLSGYQPTSKEAKTLLKKTAIPGLYSNDRPRRNGAGMLNAYKLGMVGKRLKEKCGKNRACFQREIQNPKTYEFPESRERDQRIEEAIGKAFPACNQLCGGVVDGSCGTKSRVFKELRRASLLNPSNKKHWARLACIYRTNGFDLAAENALNTYKALLGESRTQGLSFSCKKDSDCVLVPPCKGKGASPFSVRSREEAEIHYAMNCPRAFCNEACGCGGKELAKDLIYKASCNSSHCVMRTEKVASSSGQDRPPSSIDPVPQQIEQRDGGSTGQR